MQHGNVSNIASFSKKNDDLRYVSLTGNLKVARAVYYEQEQAICMKHHCDGDKIYSALSLSHLDNSTANIELFR